MQFHAPDLLANFRRKVGSAKDLTRQEANAFIADYVAGLEGYTYLEGEWRRAEEGRGNRLLPSPLSAPRSPYRFSIGTYAPLRAPRRRPAAGREIFCSLSSSISSHCATQPGSRPSAKSTVK